MDKEEALRAGSYQAWKALVGVKAIGNLITRGIDDDLNREELGEIGLLLEFIGEHGAAAADEGLEFRPEVPRLGESA